MQEDIDKNPNASQEVYTAACNKFGEQNVRKDSYSKNSGDIDFPVLTNENRIMSSWTLSKILPKIPPIASEYVFIAQHLKDEAQKWLDANRKQIIMPVTEEE